MKLIDLQTISLNELRRMVDDAIGMSAWDFIFDIVFTENAWTECSHNITYMFWHENGLTE